MTGGDDTQRGCLGTDTLVDLVEGKCTDEARARIEAHAAGCDQCRAVLSSLAKGGAMLPASESRPGLFDLAERDARIGRYELRRELGAGGMGVVYAAYDPALDRTVAVKVLRGDRSADLEARLRGEAQAMAKLAHPNIVGVHDVGTAGDRTFIAMEYVEGGTLARWTAGRSRDELLDAYRQAGRGLAAAHAAGLVHRDFKPENVMRGADGRVRVVDFGLAYPAGSRDAGSSEAVTARDGHVSPDGPTVLQPSNRTQTGMLVGTPFYMAPELYAGATADARSDQFSYCVALWVALFGERPFADGGFDARPAPPSRGVSRKIRAALRRGLARDPAARFPTMDELLVELARPPNRWPWIGAAAVTAAVAAVAVEIVVRHPAQAPCEPAPERFANVWDAGRHDAVAHALEATRAPYAAETAHAVTRALDRYAADWQVMHLGACRATRVRGEQSEAVLDLRMVCLDERLRDLGALTDSLARADRTAAEHAAAAAQALPPIDACADVAALQSRVKPPSPAVRARVDQLRAALAPVRTAHALGQYQLAAQRYAALRADIAAVGYRPLAAEGAFLDGVIARDTEQFARARTALEEAVLAAEAGRDDHTAAAAAIALVAVVGVGLGKPGEVPPLRERAAALIERIDQPVELRAALLLASGKGEAAAGQLADAERDLRAALAATEQRVGKDDPRVVEPLRELARFEVVNDRSGDALADLDRALAIQRRALGENHPDVAETLLAVGGAQYATVHYDEAIASYRAAQGIYERALGPESAAVAATLDDIALCYEWQGKLDESIDLHRKAIAIDVKVRGADHPVTLEHEGKLAAVLEENGKPAEAVAMLKDVLARQRALYGAEHPQIALTLSSLALAELTLKRYADARDDATAARAMYARVDGAAYNPLAELLALGQALRGLGDYAAAADALAEARTHVDPRVTDPGTTAWLDAQLGFALVESGRDAAHGKALVLAAWPHIAKDDRMETERAETAAWMKAHALAAPRA